MDRSLSGRNEEPDLWGRELTELTTSQTDKQSAGKRRRKLGLPMVMDVATSFVDSPVISYANEMGGGTAKRSDRSIPIGQQLSGR